MRIAIIVGTRPEIIKMSPIIRECQKKKQSNNNSSFDYFILHTGQHYSYNMDMVFFKQLNLPDAHYNLDVGSGSHARQTSRILVGIEKILLEERPDVVLIQGDTNTVLAGALAASKLHIKVGHVEAGLRSYDRTMPEEINRIIADHISDFCFVPTEQAKATLLSEGISSENIFITGNTIVDAVYHHIKLAKEKTNILETLHLQPNHFFLATAHRQENVDDKHRFEGILSSLTQLREVYNLPVVYPIHPRAKKMINQFDIVTEGITFIEPVDFFSFLQLEQHARLILTDSGGVQEESCILQRPCITLRDNTERPETIAIGANMIGGTNPQTILKCVSRMMSINTPWINPFGNGTSGKKIVNILEEKIT